MRTTLVTVAVIFSKVLFRKLFDHSCLKSSFSIITRNIDSDIWKKLTVEDFTDID